MSTDVEVVEVGTSNSLLPNLTICVENEDDDEGAIPEIEYDNEKEVAHDETSKDETEIKPRLNLFPRKKIYENKNMGGALELGLSFEEAESRRKKRAERFQSPLVETDEKVIEVDKLLAQAKPYVDDIIRFNKNLSADDEEFIRNDSLHLIGVNNMSTEDIFAYFGRTNPRHIEWVNDVSCNVVWGGAEFASIAMERVAMPYLDNNTTKGPPDEAEIYDDDLDLLKEEDDAAMDTTSSDSKLKDLPLNPLRGCREPFEKNKNKSHLEIRYARVGDRKELFAAKKSKYYMKHGNPHYGGTKGLLTSTYRKRYQMKKAMKELRDLNVPTSRPYRKNYYEDDLDGVAGKKRKMADGGEQEMMKEDESLLRSSVDNLSGESSEESDSERSYGTMVADRVSQHIRAARDMTGRDASLNVMTNNNRVHARLGKRNRDDWSESSRSRSPMRRLPADLRSRLGSKQNQTSSSKSESSRSRQRGMRDDKRKDYSSPLASSAEKSKTSSRELTRYSPPPWE